MADGSAPERGPDPQERVEGRRLRIESAEAPNGVEGGAADRNDGTDVIDGLQIIGIEGRAQDRKDRASGSDEGIPVECETLRMRRKGLREGCAGAVREAVAGRREDEDGGIRIHRLGDLVRRYHRDGGFLGLGNGGRRRFAAPPPQGVMIETEEGSPGLPRADALAGEPRPQDGGGLTGMPNDRRGGGEQARAEGRARRKGERQRVSGCIGQRTISRGSAIIRDLPRRS